MKGRGMPPTRTKGTIGVGTAGAARCCCGAEGKGGPNGVGTACAASCGAQGAAVATGAAGTGAGIGPGCIGMPCGRMPIPGGPKPGRIGHHPFESSPGRKLGGLGRMPIGGPNPHGIGMPIGGRGPPIIPPIGPPVISLAR